MGSLRYSMCAANTQKRSTPAFFQVLLVAQPPLGSLNALPKDLARFCVPLSRTEVQETLQSQRYDDIQSHVPSFRTMHEDRLDRRRMDQAFEVLYLPTFSHIRPELDAGAISGGGLMQIDGACAHQTSMLLVL